MNNENPLFEKENNPCLFCGDPVAIQGEGTFGRVIGQRTICDGCIAELKEALGFDELENSFGEILRKIKKK